MSGGVLSKDGYARYVSCGLLFRKAGLRVWLERASLTGDMWHACGAWWHLPHLVALGLSEGQ